MDPIYVGTVGMPIRLVMLDMGVPYDPTLATKLEMTIHKPGGISLVQDATPGTTTDGRPCMEYITQVGDLDVSGTYEVVGYVEDSAGRWPVEPKRLTVLPHNRGG